MRTPRTSISFTVTTEQADLIEKASRAQGGSVSGFIRSTVLISANAVYGNHCIDKGTPVDHSELDRIAGFGVSRSVTVRDTEIHASGWKQADGEYWAKCNRGSIVAKGASQEGALQSLERFFSDLSPSDFQKAVERNQDEYKNG